MASSQSAAELEEAVRGLEAAAYTAAGRDNCLDPAAPSPTPGERALLSACDHWRGRLGERQAVEAGELRARQTACRAVVDEAEAGGRPTPPTRFRLSLLVPGALLLAGVCGAEAVFLHGPIQTIMNTGGTKAWAMAFFLAVLAALPAHRAAAARFEAREQPPPAVARRLRRSTVAWLAVLVGVAAAAVCARTYDAALAAASGTGIDASGVAFYLLLQVAFIAFALGAATTQLELQERRQAEWVADRRRHHGMLALELGELAATHDRQVQQLGEALMGAVIKYRDELERKHPDTEARMAWQARTATDLSSGRLPRALRLNGTAPLGTGDDRAPGPATASLDPSASHAPGAPLAATTPPALAPDGEASEPSGNQAAAGLYRSDDDLFDAICGFGDER